MSTPAVVAGARPLWLRAAPILFLLIWSASFVFLKRGLQDTDPLTFLALRWACVVTVLLVAFAWVRPRLPAGASAWGKLAVMGLFLQAGYLIGTYLSLKLGVSAGAVALITSQQPILIGLLAPAVAGERVGAVRWAGLLLGVLGACVVILANAAINIAAPAGLFFAVMALLSLSASTLWEKRYGVATHPVTANLVQCSVGLLVVAPLAWLLEPMHVHWTPALVGSLAYLVFGTSLVAITLLLAMIRQGEASRVSALFFLVPPATALIAHGVLGEAMAPLAWVGMALAALGIYLVMRRAR
jgi:drug/metabolite transporter (DMT)-like permease